MDYGAIILTGFTELCTLWT